MPDDLHTNAFHYLNARDLARSSAVCKNWCVLTNDRDLWSALLHTTFPMLKREIDETAWKEHVNLADYGLDFEGLPPLDPRRLCRVIKRMTTSLRLEENTGISLMSIPRGLTLNKLTVLAAFPTKGHATACYVLPPIRDVVGDMPTSRAYRVIITDAPVIGSRDQHISHNQALIYSTGHRLPTILEAATLKVMTCVTFPGPVPYDLRGQETRNCTQCEEPLLENAVAQVEICENPLIAPIGVVYGWYSNPLLGAAAVSEGV